jgi:MerR family transcriptional regulator, light-induced transcriptional regulator
MVYIRKKKVKGIDYAYLVRSIWNKNKNTSRQETIKYLGKISTITINDIPLEFQNDPKILAFLSSYGSREDVKSTVVLSKLCEQIVTGLSNGDLSHVIEIYEKYTKSFGLTDFYDDLLKPVMYKIGDLWEHKRIDIATEHVCSNVAHSLVKIINERVHKPTNKEKVIICTPDGELHNIGCNVIESVLLSRGYKVFNISPSVPVDSVMHYIGYIQPDFILLSITLEENLKAGRRLVDKIRSNFSIPMIVGGQAIKEPMGENLNALIIENASLHSTLKLMKSLIKK